MDISCVNICDLLHEQHNLNAMDAVEEFDWVKSHMYVYYIYIIILFLCLIASLPVSIAEVRVSVTVGFAEYS